MRRYILTALFIFACSTAFPQGWITSNVIDGDNDVSVIQSTLNTNNDIIGMGYFEGTLVPGTPNEIVSGGSRDYFFANFDESGNIVWINQIGGAGFVFAKGGITTNALNEIFVTGSFRDSIKFTPNDSLKSAGDFDIFLAKYSAGGSYLWHRNIGSGASKQTSLNLSADNAGDLIVTGVFSDSIVLDASTTLYSDDGYDDYFYAKFDPDNGDLIWVKQIEAISNNNSGRLWGMEEGTDAYYFVGQYTDSIIIENDTLVSKNESADIHLISIDLDGNVNWVRTMGTPGSDNAYSVALDSEENIYVGGFYNGKGITIDSTETDTIWVGDKYANWDQLILKYNSSGTMQWYHTAGGLGNDYIYDLEVYEDYPLNETETEDQLFIAGTFSGDIEWGPHLYSTSSIHDYDSFLGSLALEDGSPRSASPQGGINESTEQLISIFVSGGNFFNVMTSDSRELVLDKTYTFQTDNLYMVMGVVGCLSLSIDDVIFDDMIDCAGDSAAMITILATGGSQPLEYAIETGPPFVETNIFQNLPAGNYQIAVSDAAGCTQTWPELITISQPDSLKVFMDNLEAPEMQETYPDILVYEGLIEFSGSGGLDNEYTFTLMLGDESWVSAVGSTASFVLEKPGLYVIELSNNFDCATSIDTIMVDTLLTPDYPDGIASLPGLSALIYPNPSSDQLTVELNMETDEVELEVLNLTGQVMQHRLVYTSSGALKENIDVSNLPAGIYMLRLNGLSVNNRIVVQK